MGNRTGSATSARGTVASERRGSRPFDVAPPIGYDYAYKQVGPAMRKHPGPRRHLKDQVMQVVLYYSQTRSRQEAGLFDVRG